MNEEIVYGRNPVRELIESGKPINKVLIQKEGEERRSHDLIKTLRERGIPFQLVERQVLERVTEGAKHQGIMAYIAAREYATLEEILNLARARQEDPLILALDGLEDPHNLGALLRTVDAVGAHGVIIPKRRNVALTGIVAKTSAGALEHVLVARVSNLVQSLRELKEKEGCWVSGAEAGGADIFSADLTGPRVLVIGSEGQGMSRLVRENCDEILSIPMVGKVTSLNASVAGSVLLYEAMRQRRIAKAEA